MCPDPYFLICLIASSKDLTVFIDIFKLKNSFPQSFLLAFLIFELFLNSLFSRENVELSHFISTFFVVKAEIIKGVNFGDIFSCINKVSSAFFEF